LMTGGWFDKFNRAFRNQKINVVHWWLQGFGVGDKRKMANPLDDSSNKVSMTCQISHNISGFHNKTWSSFWLQFVNPEVQQKLLSSGWRNSPAYTKENPPYSNLGIQENIQQNMQHGRFPSCPIRKSTPSYQLYSFKTECEDSRSSYYQIWMINPQKKNCIGRVV